MTEVSRSDARFVVCVQNDGYPASLERGKIYQEVPDPDAESANLVRVIDESGEDYLFPTELFLPIDLSGEVKAALLRAS